MSQDLVKPNGEPAREPLSGNILNCTCCCPESTHTGPGGHCIEPFCTDEPCTPISEWRRRQEAKADDVPVTREELAEVVASTICCHTKMSPAVQWEVDLVMGAIEKHVQLRMARVWEAVVKTAPCIPGTQEEDVAHCTGWNAAMDSIEAALAAGGQT